MWRGLEGFAVEDGSVRMFFLERQKFRGKICEKMSKIVYFYQTASSVFELIVNR